MFSLQFTNKRIISTMTRTETQTIVPPTTITIIIIIIDFCIMTFGTFRIISTCRPAHPIRNVIADCFVFDRFAFNAWPASVSLCSFAVCWSRYNRRSVRAILTVSSPPLKNDSTCQAKCRAPLRPPLKSETCVRSSLSATSALIAIFRSGSAKEF